LYPELKKMDKNKTKKPGLLIIGEWQAVKERCIEKACQFLGKDQKDNITILRGDEVSEAQVIEELKTKGLFGDKKVIIYQDPDFLFAGKGKDPVKKLAAALDRSQMKRAARLLGSALAEKGLYPDTISTYRPQELLSLLETNAINIEQIQELLTYHLKEVQKGLGTKGSDGHLLLNWLKKRDKGNRPGNSLVIIHLSQKPPASTIFKKFTELCHVENLTPPIGKGQEAKRQLHLFIRKILKDQGKEIDNLALERFVELVGTGSVSAIRNELLKLVHLCGKKNRISVKDIESLVVRHKEEEIFKLTEAFRQKRLGPALESLHLLIEQNIHPLALLAAIRNCVLKMFAIKAAANTLQINPGCPYNQFKNTYWPDMKKILSKYSATTMSKMHPYSAFVHLGSPYKISTIYDMMEEMAELDLALKGSKLDPRVVIEKFFFKYLA